jgi:hypothetical protein
VCIPPYPEQRSPRHPPTRAQALYSVRRSHGMLPTAQIANPNANSIHNIRSPDDVPHAHPPPSAHSRFLSPSRNPSPLKRTIFTTWSDSTTPSCQVAALLPPISSDRRPTPIWAPPPPQPTSPMRFPLQGGFFHPSMSASPHLHPKLPVLRRRQRRFLGSISPGTLRLLIVCSAEFFCYSVPAFIP